MKILVVDDEEIVRVTLHDDLSDAGHDVTCEGRASSALDRIDEGPFDVVISDIRMPGMDGLELLKIAKERSPDAEVIMITAYATVESAVEAMKQGAYDYIVKPYDTDKLIIVLDRLQQHRKLAKENLRLRAQLEERHGFHRIVGKSSVMQGVYEILNVVCASDSTVLVQGATGTGKELVAEAIHYNSPRRDGPLVKVSCAVLSRDVLESELFGHARGAYTGAIQDRPGRFGLADGGTLFLDEVDDIPLESQVKLLRVLESQEYERVGDATTRKTDVRIVAATKADLQELVAGKRFRDDLYYRLNVIPVTLAPLSGRREDIPLLVGHFLAQSGRPSLEVEPGALNILMTYSWPGNVRELKNLIERLALVASGDQIRVEDLPPEIRDTPGEQNGLVTGQSFNDIIFCMERRLLLEALEKTNGNKAKAADLLGMSPSTFRYKLSSLSPSDPA